ncbi:MAG: hypothetical protein ACTSX9_04130 [Candidatus Njordarchaeales archaeon]
MSTEVKIRDILENPEKFIEQRVVLSATYLGWSGGDCDLLRSSMRTRSDVTLKDDTGCIFCDFIPGLSPSKTPVKIQLEATVEVFQGRPRLKNPKLIRVLEE